MSLHHPVHFSFYWGGQIISSPSWGVEYSHPVANRAVTVRDKLTYDELVDLVCKVAAIDKNVFKVNVIFRQPRCIGSCVVYNAIKVVDDEDMEMIYDFARNMSSYCADFYVETEIISSIWRPSSSHGPFVSLLNSVPHFNPFSPLPLPVSLSEFTPPVHVVDSTNSELGVIPISPQNVARQMTLSDERVIIVHPVHRSMEERGINNENLEVHGDDGNLIFDGNIQTCASDDSSSSEEESVAPEDVGSDDDSESDHDLGDRNNRSRKNQIDRPYIPKGLAFFNDIGNINDIDPTDRGGDIERIYVWSEENNMIRLGMRFEDKKQLKKAITLWSISQNREFKVVESKSDTWVAKCKMEVNPSNDEDIRRTRSSCMWVVRAICKSTHGMWEITKWVTEHNCLGENLASYYSNLTSAVIATHITHSIDGDPCYAVKHIQTDIKKVLHVDISYKKAWHGRRKAIELVYGNWNESFADLPKYMEALQRSNPGTVVEWLHHPSSTDRVKTFKYVFWTFGQVVEAFHKCRPVISVDGTHLRGEFKGKLLVAVTHDANNYVLHLAFAIVDEETVESWC